VAPLTLGTPVTTTLGNPGDQSIYTCGGAAGDRLSVVLVNASWSGVKRKSAPELMYVPSLQRYCVRGVGCTRAHARKRRQQ
jgi:hypothetical protein